MVVHRPLDYCWLMYKFDELPSPLFYPCRTMSGCVQLRSDVLAVQLLQQLHVCSSELAPNEITVTRAQKYEKYKPFTSRNFCSMQFAPSLPFRNGPTSGPVVAGLNHISVLHQNHSHQGSSIRCSLLLRLSLTLKSPALCSVFALPQTFQRTHVVAGPNDAVLHYSRSITDFRNASFLQTMCCSFAILRHLRRDEVSSLHDPSTDRAAS